jgi:5'-3' exonuclease
MGIPSFYSKLVATYASILQSSKTRPTAGLYMDLNCAIYHCVRKLPPPPPATDKTALLAWEQSLLLMLIQYMRQIVAFVRPRDLLYIAVDGVVPVAKMHQQRLRRFRGHVQRQQTANIQARLAAGPPPTSWDSNAITPGTPFMHRLSEALEAAAASGQFFEEGVTQCRVLIEDWRSPGEGEHKIIRYMRKHVAEDGAADADHVIYGLDGDLILLAMLMRPRQVLLVREAVAFGKIKLNSVGQETLLYMDTYRLGNVMPLPAGDKEARIRDFIFLMTFLGNDFVPHGMALCIRDDGIEKLLAIYARCCSSSTYFVTADGTLNGPMLTQIISALAANETQWINEYLAGRARQKPSRPQFDSTGRRDVLADALQELEDMPLHHRGPELAWPRQNAATLRGYYYRILVRHDEETLVTEYLTGLQWVFHYYSGQPVDEAWHFPASLPPLFASVAAHLQQYPQGNIPWPHYTPPARENGVTSDMHALYVLPAASLLAVFCPGGDGGDGGNGGDQGPNRVKAMIDEMPEYFPIHFTVSTAGRRFAWECDPRIPMMHAQPKHAVSSDGVTSDDERQMAAAIQCRQARQRPKTNVRRRKVT